MSRETQEWLNTMVHVGYVAEHGVAWHGTAGADNMHDGPVPLEIVSGLFDWDAEKIPVYTMQTEPVIHPDGTLDTVDTPVLIPDKWAVADSRDHTNIFQGFVSNQYRVHQYRDWLVENVATILDIPGADVHVGSAGLLRGGSVAWVQIRFNEGITVGGDKLIPWILASTSHDGSLVTSYRAQTTRVVCDNTLDCGLSEKARKFSIRHTTNSLARISDAREALGVFYENIGAFEEEVEALMNTPVSDTQYMDLVNRLEPEAPTDASEQSRNSANARRGTLLTLWHHDARVGDYKGTAWGALNAFNTRGHWETGGPTSKTAERQMRRTAAGDVAREDRKVLSTLVDILVDA